MAEEEDDSTWVLDLEAALQEDASPEEMYRMYQGKEFPDALRAECWQACLSLHDDQSRILTFPDIFDLPEQEQIRQDCRAAVDRLGNDDADKVSVVSDMESVITCYCKTHNVPYTQGWVELLLPILALKRPRDQTYAIFEALLERLVPRHCDDNYHVLRLLILYHDPQLCSFLDTLRVTPDLFARSWFCSLFAGLCDLRVVHAIWDLYLQRNDPFFVFFLSLVIIVNGREMILALKDAEKSKVVEAITQMPSALEHDDVKDFCSLALYYVLKTPKSFRLEHDVTGREHFRTTLSQALCLPVSANELVETSADDVELDEAVDRVRFFLVDCRPAEQYNAGHLSTAFHLDSNLMLQEPAAFNVAVQGLLSAQRQALAANSQAGGNHLCFLGSGRNEEDQYTHMVVASFLQKHVLYVSMVAGGYEAIHDYFTTHYGGADISDCLEDHNERQCLVCRDARPSAPSPDPSPPVNHILGKFSQALKTKSADIKDKLIDYIVNPTGGGEPGKGKNKLYRGLQPVFSIDDDENGPDPVYEEEEIAPAVGGTPVDLAAYLNASDTVAYWMCHHLTEGNYLFPSHLVLTQTHLVVLRDLIKGKATLVVKRPLPSIVRITAKKRHPDLITFKYGAPDSDSNAICDMDRFVIPNASDATAAVSKQVLNCPLLEQIAQQAAASAS